MKLALTAAEAAEALGTTTQALAQLRYRKVGPPFVRIGESGSIRYPVAAIEAWLASRCVVNGATVQTP